MAKTFALLALAILLAAPPAAILSQDATSVVNATVAAMGAQNLRSIQISGTGSIAGIGQNFGPNAPWPMAPIKSYTRQVDLDAVVSATQVVRLQNGVEQTQNLVIPPNAPWAQQFDFWITPFGFLKGAMANPVTLSSEKVNSQTYDVVSYMLQNKYRVKGYINANKMVERVHTSVENTVLGDMPVEAYYTDYKDFAGVKFPSFSVVRQGHAPTLILGVHDLKANVPVTTPPAQQTAAPQPVRVETEQIAAGVWYLKGGSHHSVLVEFADHVAVIEAPQNEERSLAVIGEVKRLVPNKPIRYVINTHHHFDHSGGLRTYVDAGVAVVTYDGNKAFYERIFSTPRTLSPDRLAQSGRTATIEVTGERRVMGDATRTVELYRVRNPHNEGILMAYLPKEKILVQVDMYTPPAPGAAAPAADAPVNPNALALLDHLELLRLDFDTILPLHGPGKATRADLYAFVRKPLVPVSALPDPAALAAAAKAALPPPPLPAPETGADAEVAALVNRACIACHNFDRVNRKRENQAAWQATVTRMKMSGAAITDAQVPIVSEFLARILPR